MPGEHNEPEAPAGKSGLDSEDTSEGQTQGQNTDPSAWTFDSSVESMNPGENSGAAEWQQNQGSSSDERVFPQSDADFDKSMKAFDDIYGTTPPALDKDPPGSESIEVDKDGETQDKEGEDEFLCPESRNYPWICRRPHGETEVQRPSVEARAEEKGKN